MVNALVERATSDLLMGPDWAMNTEICEICNRDFVRAKDVVRGIKKRIGSKNPKVQLLALTLLETLVKNCGDVIHVLIVEKDVLPEMVKIVRKKPDFRVKEKILTVIYTWQEIFGGASGRYPQYFATFQELSRMGAVFPKRSESAAVFTTPQTQPLSSYPQNLRNQEFGQEPAESSAEAEFPTLSLTELQKARGIMDVLAEMLSALDPENKEELRQDVVVDLVEQCQTYKQRVVHLVNLTSDESLLCQGLALNDDLQQLLAKHEALASGTSDLPKKPKPELSKALVPVNAPLIDTGDGKKTDVGSTSITVAGTQSLQPAATTNNPTTPATPKMDLLSGEDDFSSPKSENLLAIVPIVGEPQLNSPATQQNNALALVDMFSQNNNYQLQPQLQNFQPPPQSPVYNISFNTTINATNVTVPPSMMSPQYEQPLYGQGTSPTWSGQMSPQQSPSPVYCAQIGGSFPPPPWEVAQPASANSSPPAEAQYQQPIQTSQMGIAPPQPMPGGGIYPQGSQPTGNDQATGMYVQPNNQTIQPNQMVVGVHPQQMGMYQSQQMQYGQMGYTYSSPQQMYGNLMPGYGYGNGYGYGYGYSQQQNNQFLEQRMSGLSVREDGAPRNSSYLSTPSSYVASGKPTKPDDKLFGDLIDITTFKPTKTTTGRAGSM